MRETESDRLHIDEHFWVSPLASQRVRACCTLEYREAAPGELAYYAKPEHGVICAYGAEDAPQGYVYIGVIS